MNLKKPIIMGTLSYKAKELTLEEILNILREKISALEEENKNLRRIIAPLKHELWLLRRYVPQQDANKARKKVLSANRFSNEIDEPIENLNMSTWLKNRLLEYFYQKYGMDRNKIATLRMLDGISRKELLSPAIRGFGESCLKELEKLMGQFGLTLEDQT